MYLYTNFLDKNRSLNLTPPPILSTYNMCLEKGLAQLFCVQRDS